MPDDNSGRFINTMNSKIYFTNEDACKYFSHFFEDELVLGFYLYGYHIKNDPCDKDQLNKKSIFLNCLKKWLVDNKYYLGNISYIDENKNQYGSDIKVKFGNKVLIFSVGKYEPTKVKLLI